MSHYLYDQWVGMPKDFRLGGRHTIAQCGNGRCDLVITNITSDDAGTYECSEDMGDADKAELVVLGEVHCLF